MKSYIKSEMLLDFQNRIRVNPIEWARKAFDIVLLREKHKTVRLCVSLGMTERFDQLYTQVFLTQNVGQVC